MTITRPSSLCRSWIRRLNREPTRILFGPFRCPAFWKDQSQKDIHAPDGFSEGSQNWRVLEQRSGCVAEAFAERTIVSAISFKPGARFLAVPRQGDTEHQLPSRVRQALNFGRSIVRSAVSQSQGNPRHVTNETRDTRRAICKSNDCGFFRATDGRCANPRCGCPTQGRGIIESKTELFSEFCPAHPRLWGPGEIYQIKQP